MIDSFFATIADVMGHIISGRGALILSSLYYHSRSSSLSFSYLYSCVLFN
jgi:hypothetical protein